MTKRFALNCAPCCWGVDDVSNPHLPAWQKVLDEASLAGFSGLELGPYGYMPLDVGIMSDALDRRNLRIVAGTIFDDLVSAGNRENLLKQTRQICALISKLPAPLRFDGQRHAAPYLTVMDWGHDERDYAAGHADRAPRLSKEDWQGMMDTIRLISTIARDEFGIRATIHPHAGGYIEFLDEIERLEQDIPPEVAGFCLDTGHLAYAGMDPVETLGHFFERVDYLHFKDIDPVVQKDVMSRRIRFFEACAEGVMCPIGQGIIDYAAVHRLLVERDYRGHITIEQERDPRNSASVLDNLATSRRFLAETGF